MKYLSCLLMGAVACTVSVASSPAATINATNYSLEPLNHKPIVLVSGTVLTTGGVVQIGSFMSPDISGLLADLNSPAGLAALLADFIAFGSSTTMGGQGGGFEGIYDLVAQAPIAAGNPLVGKPIYTLIGNNATLAASTELFIVKDDGIFDVDAPLYVTTASLLDTNLDFLLGNPSGPVVSANPVFPPAPSLATIPIPEPGAFTLMLSAVPVLFRRRRQELV